MKKVIIFSLSSFIILFLTGCIKNNPAPSWLQINEWELIENPNLLIEESGELTENFSDAWVYVDGDLVGVFELPCKIPVLTSGVKNVKVYPTILNNGISATKKIYPFVVAYEVSVDLIKNEITTINPQTHYKEQCQFRIEDFEFSSFAIVNGSGSLTTMQKVSDPSILQDFNGTAFGRISLNDTEHTYQGSTDMTLLLPKGQEVYLEIDYHNTTHLTTGILGLSSVGSTTNPNVRLNAQNANEVQWKKIYIDLGEVVSSSTNAEYFEITLDALLEDGVTSGEVNVDNIKLVHF